MNPKEKVFKSLKATLVSTKGSISIHQCNRDYRELEGENIPYKKLGFSTLEDLFLSCPDFKVTRSNGEMLVDAAPMRETSHITSLISYQKNSKKASKPKSYFSNKNWRQPNVSSNYNVPRFSSYKQNTNYISPHKNYSNNGFNNNFRSRNEMPPPPVKQSQQQPQRNQQNANRQPQALIQPPVSQNVAKQLPSDKNNKENLVRTLSAPKPSAPIQSKSTDRGKSEDLSTKLPLSIGIGEILQGEVTNNNQSGENISKKKKKKRSYNMVRSNTARSTALQRLTALRNSLNTVDIIPLPIPAVTNEKTLTSPEEDLFRIPVPDVAIPELDDVFPENATFEVKLEWLCRRLNLPEPFYKVHANRPKRGAVMYDCNIKIGMSHSASSYPQSALTEIEARETAAAKLVAVLEKDMASLPASAPPVAMQRLATLLRMHPAGVWASTVPQMYKEEYGENLPPNWEKLVECCPSITTDRLANGLPVLIANEMFSDDVYEKVNESFSSEESTDAVLPPLMFPESNCWNVYITAANSTIEVWLRLVGEEYSDSYEKLVDDMNEFYKNGGAAVTVPVENYWYVVQMEDSWLRAKLLEVTPDGKASVFLIDHGDDDTVSVSDLRQLEPQFCKLPAQAILCRLEGLEELGSCSEGADIVRARLVDEALVAAPGATSENDHTIPVTLYDTSGDKDVDLNQLLIEDFARETKPVITNDVMEVEVGCVSTEGRVWVCTGWGGGAIRSALLLLTEAGLYAKPPPPHKSLSRQQLYAVHTAQGEWVRCCIRNCADDAGVVPLRLIDSGRSMLAPVSALHPLASWSPALNQIPPQAVQVRLANAEGAAGSLAGRLRELLLGTRVLCRLASRPSAGDASVPAVDLFVRTEPQNILASVNNALYMEWDLIKKGKTVEEPRQIKEDELHLVKAFHKKKEKIFSRQPSGIGLPSSNSTNNEPCLTNDVTTGLPQIQLPPVGSSFDVYITMAANPWNFWIQPNHSRKELKDMMSALQEQCPTMAMVTDSIKPGELYAAFYDKDNSWYRVAAVMAMGSELVSVNFVDYGELSVVARDTLRLLPQEHIARKLPAQAVRASLHDIWPLHKDWTPEDCIKFQELVVEQQLVAIVKEVTPKLSVELIDTTTEDDIYLAGVLCKEKRATNIKPAER